MTANYPEVAEPQIAKQIKIHDNLDEIERDSDEVREPYGFVWGGHVLQAGDPANLDWQQLMDLDGELEVMKRTMSDEDLGKFTSVEGKTGWQLRDLVKRYLAHFGIENPGKAG